MVSVAKGGKELKLAFPQNLKHACSLPYQIMLAQAGTDVIPSMFLLPSNNNLQFSGFLTRWVTSAQLVLQKGGS